MPITLNGFVFDAARTTAVEKHEEAGGQDARVIVLRGLLETGPGLQPLDEALDVMLSVASAGDAPVPLSLRPGRLLWVRRTAFSREHHHDGAAAAFTLTLEARDPFEYDANLTSEAWSVSSSGEAHFVIAGGAAPALPVVAVAALSDLAEPAISDGQRTLRYDGVVPEGSTLLLDSAAGHATLDGEDVTPYTSGEFPQLAPGLTFLTYTDGPDSGHSANLSATWRNRWW